MNHGGQERCGICGVPAQVRMQGRFLCARCGLERSSNSDITRRRSLRAVFVGLLSWGFLSKMVVGAVALAAVGGVAASLPGQAPATSSTTIQSVAPENGPAILVAGENPTDEQLVEQVLLYAAEVQAWGECVSAAARTHSGGAFDPAEKCGESPKAAAHGLGSDRSMANSEDRAAKADEKAAQKAVKADDEADDPPNKPDKPDKPDLPEKAAQKAVKADDEADDPPNKPDKPDKPDLPEKAERPVGDDPEGDG